MGRKQLEFAEPRLRQKILSPLYLFDCRNLHYSFHENCNVAITHIVHPSTSRPIKAFKKGYGMELTKALATCLQWLLPIQQDPVTLY